MADEVSVALGWVANYSNFYSVLSVLVCFILMVVFILRLNGDNLLSSSSTHHNPIKELPMIGLQSPFAVHLSSARSSSLKDGVHLELSVLQPSYAAVFWEVNIKAFQREIQLGSDTIISRLRNRETFDGCHSFKNDYGRLDNLDDKIKLNIKCPDCVTEDSLGAPPRSTYPLVVVTGIDQTDVHVQDLSAVVLQFTVIHLKDSICSLDSHIVYQFLKTQCNQLLSLQPIFMSASDTGDNIGDQTTPQGLHSERINDVYSNTIDTQPKRQKGGEGELVSDSHVSQTQPIDLQNSTEDPRSQLDNDPIEGKPRNIPSSEIDHDSKSAASSECQCNSTHTRSDIEQNSDDIDFSEDAELCVVCQANLIVFTLLPCRHACVCVQCVTQLTSCPICRAYIDSYFSLHSDSSSPSSDPTSGENVTFTQPARWGWEWFNNRLNETLGFN